MPLVSAVATAPSSPLDASRNVGAVVVGIRNGTVNVRGMNLAFAGIRTKVILARVIRRSSALAKLGGGVFILIRIPRAPTCDKFKIRL